MTQFRRILHICSFFMLGSPLWAFSVEQVTGHVDRLDPGQVQWRDAKAGDSAAQGEMVRLERASSLLMRGDSGVMVEILGKSSARVQQLASPTGGVSDLVLSEWSGMIKAETSGKSLGTGRFQCGAETISQLKGRGWFLCARDSGDLWVRMKAGSVLVQLRDGQEVHLKGGQNWRITTIKGVLQTSFEDSAQAAADFRKVLGIEVDTVTARGKVRLFWNDVAAPPEGSHWRIGVYLGEMVRQLPGIVESGDSLEWRLTTKIDRFTVQNLGQSWKLDFSLSLLLENSRSPFLNRALHYEKHEALANMDPNHLELLELIPLDAHNQRINASIFGQIRREVQALLQAEVLDPFKRSGILIDE